MYNILQLREIFHLQFLKWFNGKIRGRNFALKGGVNLRFFFNSFRYSEDMELDIWDIQVYLIKDMVMHILQELSFRELLQTCGIKRVIPPDIKKAKQTQTTQRFKVHLITSSR